MKVRITYSNKQSNNDNLYKIFCDVIKKDMDKKRKTGEQNEKNSSTFKS